LKSLYSFYFQAKYDQRQEKTLLPYTVSEPRRPPMSNGHAPLLLNMESNVHHVPQFV
jgi:hypothetical protein